MNRLSCCLLHTESSLSSATHLKPVLPLANIGIADEHNRYTTHDTYGRGEDDRDGEGGRHTADSLDFEAETARKESCTL
jgi:hypothetical protein